MLKLKKKLKDMSKTGHRLRPPADVVLHFHGGLCCQQLLGALHAAEGCCPMQWSLTSAPAEWRSRRAVSTGDRWAPRGLGQNSGRPRRRPSPRGTPRPPGGRPRLPSAALTRRTHRRLGRGCRGRGEVAPDGREVAVARRVRNVVVSARGGMKTEMTMFFSVFFLWSFCFL